MLCQFGRPVGDPITSPGLHFKMPFVQQVNSFDKRFLTWDGPMVEISIKDKTYMVLERIYQRMISERLQIAERFRSEGEGEAARINGNKERDLNQIKSTACKQVQEIQGEADAKATEIYAIAYAQSPGSADLSKFLKSMETYRKVINTDATIVLSTDSDLYTLLKRVEQKNH